MIRIAWKLNNMGEAHHDVYVSASPMSWPDNMPAEVTHEAEPGEWELLLELDPMQTWYVMIVAKRQKKSGGMEYAASDLWTYQGIPQAVWDSGGLYENVSGILTNAYEHLETRLPGLRNASLVTIGEISHLDEDRMTIPHPSARNATLVTIADAGQTLDSMQIPLPGIRNMKLTTA